MTIRPRTYNKSSFSRDAWIEIDLNAIEHNFRLIRQHIKANTKIMAVVKSDAYGHGASVIAPVLESCGADYFGVASVDEGIQLREANVKKDILILSPTPEWCFRRAIQNNLQISISNLKTLESLKKLSEELKAKIQIQICLNTGMNREGVKEDAHNLIDSILKLKNNFEIKGIFSHLAFEGDHDFSFTQQKNLLTILKNFKDKDLGLIHLGASPSLINKDLNFDMLRIGIALYGLGNAIPNLKPALSLYARLTLIQKLKKQEGVGYDLNWKAEKDSLIGLLPLGYADGIKRGLSNKIELSYKGQLFKQIGNISMDQTTVDLTDLKPIPEIGDTITLIGNELKVSDWAKILNTIEYEIVCDLRTRLPRVYVRN